MPAVSGAPDDQADGSGALAVDQHLARPDDDRVGNLRIGDRDARDVEFGVRTVERPAVSSTRSGMFLALRERLVTSRRARSGRLQPPLMIRTS